jgi:hypothetical protein
MNPLDITLASREYNLVKAYYREGTAFRSKVPLMNHIDEGLAILSVQGAWTATMQAFCLHPLLQNDPVFQTNWKTACAAGVNGKAICLAMEYRRCANAYLCTPSTDDFTQAHIKKVVGLMIPPVRMMLVADKIQNFKDFLAYHQGTHPRSAQLAAYFENWLEFLEVSPELLALIERKVSVQSVAPAI